MSNARSKFVFDKTNKRDHSSLFSLEINLVINAILWHQINYYSIFALGETTTHKLFQLKIIYSYDPSSVIQYKLDMISDLHISRFTWIMNIYCSTIIKTSQKSIMRNLQFWNDTKLTKIFSYEILCCFMLKYKVNQYCPTYAFSPCTMCLTLVRNIFEYKTILTARYLCGIDVGLCSNYSHDMLNEIEHVNHIFIQIFLNVL